MARELSVTLTGAAVMQRDLRALGRASANLRPLVPKIDEILREEAAKSFESEGPGWKELADSTVAQRGSAHPILVRTGKLKRSYTRKGSDHIAKASRDELQFGSRVPYATFHQTGTRNMPARPVKIGKEAEQKIARLIERHLGEVAGGAA